METYGLNTLDPIIISISNYNEKSSKDLNNISNNCFLPSSCVLYAGASIGFAEGHFQLSAGD